ncbi:MULTISPECIES: KTSC domain-containing protein [Microbacterium]|uniref:KTSC domain-containing protein n=1 Tax=Microbacterium wangchenii TaxID=2541726 RepID=A0ABX5SW49_9MICO|nr:MULTISPECIES: KTSC domain-containing protein [Microbacterium]MCK6067709.1 KTSC domain-containing protein [Microbacterium sp. EYE_512]QBR89377.1 KTSC domain-containing protein [Microbacterium wangchenii]TXK11050.1 KTSC domain-containing protein [Microbacterium wangchenii]
MRRTRVRSGAIASVGYDPATAVLEIEFTSGDVYEYFAVPPSAHRGLVEAESIGRHFLAHIRDVYPDRRVR